MLYGFFGTITQPSPLDGYGTSGQIIPFINNMMVFVSVVGGLIALFNIVFAGFQYITSNGDTKTHEKVMQKFNMSILGLLLLVSAPIIMGIIGWVLFGNATYFLNPKLVTP